MRAFLTLCLIAAVSAQGYNYGVSTKDNVFSAGSSFSETNVAAGNIAPTQTITQLNKEIYLYSAPEEQVQGGGSSQSATVKKNLRILFVKAPENNIATQIGKHITEHQTAIFILDRQNDVSDIAEQLKQVSEIHSQKPVVHFVKYRTAQDALNAQQTIQAQYDSLGGSSKSSNEGVAPVLNYASSAPVSSDQGSASQLSASIAELPAASASTSYLPPAV